MPHLDALCAACNERWGAHYDTDCPNHESEWRPQVPTIIGYTYDADTHCIPCTQRYASARPTVEGGVQDVNGVPDNLTDGEGNLVRPMFDTDDGFDYDVGCGSDVTVEAIGGPFTSTCGYLIRESAVDWCDCGDGCEAGDCFTCNNAEDYGEDDDEPYDESFESDGCSCPDCVAASEYRPDVT